MASKIKLLLTSICVIFPLVVFGQTQATITINPNLPGISNISTVGPCGWIVNFYTFALIIAGILAFGAMVYGGFRYATSVGNASKQSEGRSWIWNALIGMLLLGGAYIILITINPNLVTCSLPTLSIVNVQGSPSQSTGGGNPPAQPQKPITNGSIPNSQACQDLTKVGISVSCSQLTGVQSSTIDALTDLTKECPGDGVSVSSVASGGHSTKGGCTHQNGYKADVRPNSALNSCITSFKPDGTRGDGAPLYLAPDGAIYADERTRPPKCGINCQWTGAHWDMQSCGVQ